MPAATIVTVVPETVQMPVVELVVVTASPELAVGAIEKVVAAVIRRSAIVAKVIVCARLLTVEETVVLVPLTAPVTSQVPAARP